MADLKLGFIGHGGDYNPDQWRHIPGTLESDIRLMKMSGMNLMSVGIFSWTALEPEEGKYDFGWLRNVLDRLYENGIYVFLATPSGARPAWMDMKYKDVMRVREDGTKEIHGVRHNHCFTSPAYRHLVTKINAKLAEEFGNHPAVKGWHISNEYNGECHCEACQTAFREFLRRKFGTLDKLNTEYWTGFWSKTYTDWNQLHSPTEIGETAINGLNVDWLRFVTYQTIDFMKCEIAPIKKICPNLPITTNMHGVFPLDYYKFKDLVDFASYDAYPTWGSDSDIEVATGVSFWYDAIRSIKLKPWALLESTPSMTNWQNVCRPKRPGMNELSSIQAMAHGADTVQYFQWRKSRGSCEMWHGAVVGHDGTENTRVFKEVSQLGARLKKLTEIEGKISDSQVAVLFDQDNRNAVNLAQGARRDKQYEKTVLEHYHALKNLGVNVDIIDEDANLDNYKLITAPMLFMIKPGFAEKLERFVQNGGTLAITYWSGLINENNLAFLGGAPGPIRDIMGVWCEETDAFYDNQKNAMVFEDGKKWDCGFLADILHAENAEVVAAYESDYYAGTPALTKNRYGNGSAWYIASRLSVDNLTSLYSDMFAEARINPIVSDFSYGVQVTERDGIIFILNFAGEGAHVELPDCTEVETGRELSGKVTLKKYEALIVRRK